MDDYKPAKTKTPQKEDLISVNQRDLFMTPNYATNLLVPFLESVKPLSPYKNFVIWECAAGEQKMVRFLRENGFEVVSTDLNSSNPFNFLTDVPDFHFDFILTNPPFSLKQKFYKMCKQYYKEQGKGFALLIPADYSGWTIQATVDGAQKIIPERRIDYLTPNILQRIREGEVWETYLFEEFGDIYKNVSEFKKRLPMRLDEELQSHPEFCVYDNIYDAPAKMLRKYSSSDFHSMWFTEGFNLGKTETFVPLSNADKDNI